MEIRYHIMQFSTSMEENMRKCDQKKGRCGWVDMDPKKLLENLMDKVLELSDAMSEPDQDNQKIIDKCADTANFSMMISAIARRRKNE